MGLRENKLNRANQKIRVKNKYAVGDSQPTPDEQLTRLEEDIRLGDDRTLTYAQRFRYNSLIARYNAFRDLWRRIMQGREEGRDQLSAARASAKQQARVAPEPVSFVCADAHKDVETVKNLYESLIEAKTQCGEPTEDLSFPRFHSLIASKADGLKERLGCERVRFSVTIESGHVSFKAKADKGDTE